MSDKYFTVNIRAYLDKDEPTYIGEESLYDLLSDFSSFLTLKLRFPVGSLTDVREVSALVCGHGQLRQLLRQNALRYLDWIRQNYE